MKIDKQKKEEIKNYLSKNIEDLYYEIGEAVYSPPTTTEGVLAFITQPDFIKIGKETFKEIKKSLYKTVCDEWNYCEKKDLYQDEVTLVSIIADVISTSISGVPVVTIATLLVKVRLNNFCGCR